VNADRFCRATGVAMGTTFLVVVHRDDQGLLAGAVAHLDDLERRWSRFLPDSELSILNRRPGVPVIVSPDTFQVLRAAADGSRATGGRFDPTVIDTMEALGYDRSFDQIGAAPPAKGVGTAAPGVTGIVFDEVLHAITLPVGVRLDLGGIGKGTAADLVSGRLLARGARGAAVSVGGDVRVRGESPDGAGWVVSHDGTPLDLAPLGDAGVCTSTVSRRRWLTEAGRVHHIIDPRTGEPTVPVIESVTVVGATAQQAEVLTKAAMVAGPDAPAFLEAFGVTAFVRPSIAA
jgi:FAD:protein FMN transferase